MKYEASNTPCFKSEDQNNIIQADTEVRLKIMNVKAEENNLVFYLFLFFKL
jgi:hypothetical protein